MAARQRILQQPIKAKLENAKKYAIAAITFDNYIFMTNNISSSPIGFIDSETNDGEIVPRAWRKFLIDYDGAAALRDLTNVRGSMHQTCAATQRHNLQSYFINTYAVEWQVNHVTSCGRFLTI